MSTVSFLVLHKDWNLGSRVANQPTLGRSTPWGGFALPPSDLGTTHKSPDGKSLSLSGLSIHTRYTSEDCFLKRLTISD